MIPRMTPTGKTRHIALRVACAAFLAYLCASEPSLVVGQPPEKLEVLFKLNEARRNNGLSPLAWSPLLERAAQRHSDDMASRGFLDETGSDGSSPGQRIEAAGYAAWPRRRIWAESLYAGQGDFDEALNFLLSDEGQRRTLLNPKLREVGIGIAKDNLRTYWTLTFGAQPNLLPIFINDDAPVTNERQVAVTLTQEEAVPEGDINAIGRVIEVRLSSRPDFADATWQPWERLIPFTLAREPGIQTIYVEMRDGAGRTTIASDSIAYDPNARNTIRPVSPGEVTMLPDAIETTSPAAVATPALGDAMAAVVTLPPEPMPDATPVPEPQPTPAAVIVLLRPAATPTLPPDTLAGTPITLTLPPDSGEILQRSDPVETSGLPMEWIIPVYLIAQVGVIALGLFALLRRR